MPTIIDFGSKGAALSGVEYDTNLTLPVTPVTGTPFTVLGSHNRDTLELKSGAEVVNLTAYATLIAEDTGDFEVTIKNRSGGVATISAAGVETFDGVDADLTLADGDSITLKAGSVAGDFMRLSPDVSPVHIFGGVVQGILVSSGQTRFTSVYPGGVVSASESAVWFPTLAAGILKNFYVRVGANTADIGVTFIIYVNGSATSLGVTIGAASLALTSNTTNSHTVAVGDLLSIGIIGTGMTGALSDLNFALELA